MLGYKWFSPFEWRPPRGDSQISEILRRTPSVAYQPRRKALKKQTQYNFQSVGIYVSGIARHNLRLRAKLASEAVEYGGWCELRLWNRSIIFAFKSENALYSFEALGFIETIKPP